MRLPDWERVAAPGTDPVRLAAVVARGLRPGGSPSTAARRLVHLTVEEPDLPPCEAVVRLAPDPSRTELDAIAPVAATWSRAGVRACVLGDPTYPTHLLRGWQRFGPPLLLAWRGPDAGLGGGPRVAVVGARRATAYGSGIAAWLAQGVSAAGVTVVSGGAVGIDAAAHRATAGVPSGTVVVLGCGHDVPYPQAHARPGGLFDQVLDDGGWIVSEQLPWVEAKPPNVLARNRIVAGLADAVVVVEGTQRSGSLRTATAAADRGIPLLAVPGDVRAPTSGAPNRLLREGATPCTEPADVLEVVGRPVEPGARPAQLPSTLPEAVARELTARWPRPIRIDDLAAVTGVGVGPLLAALTRARIAGEIAEGAEGIRLTRAP